MWSVRSVERGETGITLTLALCPRRGDGVVRVMVAMSVVMMLVLVSVLIRVLVFVFMIVLQMHIELDA